MADLILTGMFDPSEIIEGLQKVMATAGEMGASVAAGIAPVEGAIQAAGQSAQQLLGQFGALGEEAEGTTPGFTAVANTSQAASEATANLAVSFKNAAGSVDTLLGPLLAVGEIEDEVSTAAAAMGVGFAGGAAGADELLVSLGATSGELAQIVEVADEATTAVEETAVGFDLSATSAKELETSMGGLLTQLGAVGEGALELTGAQSTITDSAAAATSAISAEDAVLAEMADAQTAAAAGVSGVAEQEARVAIVTQETAQALKRILSVLEVIGGVSTNTAEAFNLLGDSTAQSASSVEQITQAIETANNSLKKLNLQLVESDGGFKLVGISAKGAAGAVRDFSNAVQDSTAKMDASSSSQAYAATRLGAYASGLGSVGFALGGVARNSQTLGPILAKLFPIFLVVTFTDLIINLADKISNLDTELLKARDEFDNLAASMVEAAESTELQNLKLQDQIDKLEGRPTTNRLAEALLESKLAADKLAAGLEQDTLKAIELLEKASGFGSFMKALAAGEEPTGELKEALKDVLTAHAEAVAAQRAALAAEAQDDNAFTKKAKEQADARVEQTREEIVNKLKEVKRGVEGQMALQEASGAVPGAKGAGAVGKPAPEVEAAFRSNITYLNDLMALYTEEGVRINNVTEAEKLRGIEANAANAAQARGIQRTTESTDIKALQEAAKLRVKEDKQTAEQIYNQEQLSIADQIELEIDGGKSRAQAESDAVPLILAAREKLTQALLAAAADEYLGEKAVLDKRQELLKTEVGADKVAKQKEIDTDQKNLEKSTQLELAAIASAGEDELTKIRLKGAKDRSEVRKATTQEQISSMREEARTLVSEQQKAESQVLTQIRADSENELRVVQAKEQLHLITAQQGLAERIAILSTEQAAISEASKDHIKALEEERTKVSELYDTLTAIGIPARALQELVHIYNQLSIEIDKASTSQENLNTKIRQAQIDAQIKAWEDYQKTIAQFVTTSVNSFNSFVEDVFTSNKTLAQDLQQTFFSIEKSFIQMLLHMIEETSLFKALEAKVQTTLDKIFRIPVAPPITPTATETKVGEAGPGIPVAGGGIVAAGGIIPSPIAGAAGAGEQKVAVESSIQEQIRGLQIQTNSTLATLYQQDLAAYISAQGQKLSATVSSVGQQTAVHTTGEVQQTTITGAGVAQRSSISLSEAPATVIQEQVKTTAHATGEAQRTAATYAGVLSRQSIENLGVFGTIARLLFGVSLHKAAEVEKTTATIAGETTRTSVENVGIFARIARVLFGKAIHTGAEAEKTTATVAGQAKQTIAVAAGQAAQTTAITSAKSAQASADISAKAAKIASNAALAHSDAATAAAIVFEEAIEQIPFPVNIAAAPALAGKVYAEGEGFAVAAAAQQGALLEKDMTVFAHAKEMILPADISVGLQTMISASARGFGAPGFALGAAGATVTGGEGGPNIHYHAGSVQAIDTSGAEAFYARSRAKFTREITRALATGKLPVRF